MHPFEIAEYDIQSRITYIKSPGIKDVSKSHSFYISYDWVFKGIKKRKKKFKKLRNRFFKRLRKQLFPEEIILVGN